MAQQTAVEWLENQIKSIDIGSGIKMKIDIPKEFLEKAKQMEKEQIINTYLNACARVTPYGYYNDSAEQYYNETYGSNNQI